MLVGKILFCTCCFSMLGVLLIILLKSANVEFCNTIDTLQLHSSDYLQRVGLYGKWVKEESALPKTCQYVKKKVCCRKKQKLHFVFYDDELNKVNPISELRNILENKSILLFGDSIMVELYNGTNELLKITQPQTPGTKYNPTGTKYKPTCTKYNIDLLMAYTIYIQGTTSILDLPTSVTEETVRREVEKHDIIVFNQGLHYTHGPVEQVSIYFYYIGKLLHELTYNTTKQVF